LPNFLKPILALVVSGLIYVGYLYLADAQLLNFIQTRFYNPSVLNSYVKENNVDAGLIQNHIFELQDKFLSVLNEPVVRRSFLYNQSAEDIYERSRVFGVLLETTGGLQSVQFVDSNGIRLHYSTALRDILSQTPESAAYRNYNEDSQALPYETVSVLAGNSPKYTMDEPGGRVIFSYPFNDSMDVYRGTALFYISIRSLAERLVAESRINVSDVVSVIEDPPGILLGTPEMSKADIYSKVSGVWNEGVQDQVILNAEGSNVSFSLISTRTGNGMFFGRLVNNLQFTISEYMEMLFKLSMFLTFYLTVFFLFNLKPNPVTLVRNRIKRLRENLFEQLYVNKSAADRVKWILGLEQRREEIRSELKRNMRLRGKAEARVDSIINNTWDELLNILKSGSGYDLTTVKKAESQTAEAEKTEKLEAVEAIEEIEEAEAAADTENVDEIEEAEALDDAEEIEEIDEIEEPEAIDEAEEIDEIEEIDEVEALVEAEELEEIVEVELSSETDDAVELEEIEEISEAETAPVHSKGLLELASEKAAKETTHKGLLGMASELSHKHTGGLLAAAEGKDHGHDDSAQARRGLLALASEIEFNYPINIVDEEPDDFPDDIDVVSPFSSMFSALDINDDRELNDDDEESKEEDTNANEALKSD